MFKRSIVFIASILLVLGLAACNEKTNQTTSASDPDLTGNGYQLELGEGISTQQAKDLLSLLPTETLKNAEVVVIKSSTLNEGEEYLVFASWQDEEGCHIEIWSFAQNKMVAEPIFTL